MNGGRVPKRRTQAQQRGAITGAVVVGLLVALSLVAAACGATEPPPPDYTVVAKDQRTVGRDLRYYLTHVVDGAEREVEVKPPCFELAAIGEIVPETTVTQYRDVTVVWSCR